MGAAAAEPSIGPGPWAVGRQPLSSMYVCTPAASPSRARAAPRPPLPCPEAPPAREREGDGEHPSAGAAARGAAHTHTASRQHPATPADTLEGAGGGKRGRDGAHAVCVGAVLVNCVRWRGGAAPQPPSERARTCATAWRGARRRRRPPLPPTTPTTPPAPPGGRMPRSGDSPEAGVASQAVSGVCCCAWAPRKPRSGPRPRRIGAGSPSIAAAGRLTPRCTRDARTRRARFSSRRRRCSDGRRGGDGARVHCWPTRSVPSPRASAYSFNVCVHAPRARPVVDRLD